jgi:glycosyltransferase involved in cell wall biosynthesis
MESRSPAAAAPFVSVVVPCRDEAGNLPVLIEEIGAALAGTRFEVIVVDDGSTDASADTLGELAETRPWLRHVRHARSCGQSAAVRTGLLAAKGEIVATIDGDGQNDPVYLPKLVARLIDGGGRVGIVAGQRQKRTDSGLKRIASRFANGLRGAILKDGTADSGCGLKVLRRDLFLLLPYFDGWHRYLPALVIREGFLVAHLDVVDRKRRHGMSKYGILDRGLVGILDLFGVWWLRRRRKRIPEVTEMEFHDR